MKFPHINIRRIKGFGLVEVLLATVILGVGVVGVAKFQGNIYKDGSISKQRAEALKIAEEKLEDLRHFNTMSDYENKITPNLSGVQTLINTSISRQTTTYALKAYAIPNSNGRSAKLSVEVTWADLTNSGNITPSTTINLSTIISNTTPNTLTMTTAALGPAPSIETPLELILEEPSDTGDLTANNPEACACQTSPTASNESNSVDNSSFVKVMMRRGGTSSTSTTTTTLTAEYCNVCCNYAIPGTISASLNNNESYYADFKNKLNEFLIAEEEKYQKTSMDDQSISDNQFNPTYLIKGYKKEHKQNNNLYEKFLKKTMMHRRGGGTTTVTKWAICSFVTITTTTSSIIRGCKVWASQNN